MRIIIIISALFHFFNAANAENMPEIIHLEKDTLHLCAQHTLKFAKIVNVANVGIYFQNCDLKKKILDIENKLIRFNYQIDIKATKFQTLAEKYFLKNLIHQDDIYLIRELNKFNNYYQDMEASDSYDLYHQNGNRLELFKNSKLLGFSEYSDFNFKYFNIWFGKHPAFQSLKNFTDNKFSH